MFSNVEIRQNRFTTELEHFHGQSVEPENLNSRVQIPVEHGHFSDCGKKPIRLQPSQMHLGKRKSGSRKIARQSWPAPEP